MEEQEIKKQNKKRKRKRIRIKKRNKLIIIICYELVLGMIMINILMHSVSLNSSDEIQYADRGGVDDIRCEESTLIVNDVYVSVPPSENISYNISYSWGKNDKKYPSVPRSITALYKNKEGSDLYDISLYKESFTPNNKIKLGRNHANWFRGWKTGQDANIKREHKDTETVYGFLTDTVSTDEDALVFENTLYYFTVPSDDGVAVYILEANLYNQHSKDDLKKAMSSAISSIKIGPPDEPEEESEEFIET